MIIDNLRLESARGWSRIVATVSWEDSERTPLDLYFAVPEDDADHLELAAEPFVAASVLPALADGEARLIVKAPVCPIFLDGVGTNLDFITRWYPQLRPIKVAAEDRRSIPGRPLEERIGLLFSGGVDSQFTLYRWNTLLPHDHPARIHYCFNIDYNEFRRHEPEFRKFFTDANLALFEQNFPNLAKATGSMGAKLCQVRTNLQALNDKGGLWIALFHGAAMAGLSHAVGRKLTGMLFASGDIPLMRPYGSHPLTDPLWSSQNLRIRHDTMRFSRLAKTRAIADWPEGLAALQVCVAQNSRTINCGGCGKCLRTKLMLLCLGKLEGAPFPKTGVDLEDLRDLSIQHGYEERQFKALLPALRKIGRQDLADAIAAKLEDYAAVSNRQKAIRPSTA